MAVIRGSHIHKATYNTDRVLSKHFMYLRIFPFGLIQYTWDDLLYILSGHRLKFPNKIVFLSLKIVFVLAVSVDPDEMLHHVEISNNVVCVTSKDSDQPAQTCSRIRAFASRFNIL